MITHVGDVAAPACDDAVPQRQAANFLEASVSTAAGWAKLLVCAAAIVVAAGIGASAARADDGGLLTCGGESSQVFAQFGDYAQYRLVPGGNFEGPSGWSFSGGARTVAGNEPFNVGGGGAHSLSLPAGSSATSPVSCLGANDPTLRFFVIETGASSGSLQVEVLFRTLLGILPVKLKLASVNGTSAWQPSQTILNLSSVLGSLSLDLKAGVQFRFTPKSGFLAPASFRIDDVYVDPFGLGNSG